MKKVIAILTLFLAFSVSANAQDKKVLTSAEAAKLDMAVLYEKITDLNPTLKADLRTLMISKHDALSNPNLSKGERENVSKGTERKLLSGLSEAQRNELLKYPEVIKQLTH